MDRYIWTPITRRQHSREQLRYGSDLIRCRVDDLRAIAAGTTENRPAAAMADARADECDLLRVALGLPLADGTNQLCAAQDRVRWSLRFREGGAFEANQPSAPHDREGVGREASVLDSRNVKTNEAGDPRGYEAGKQVKDRWQSLPYPGVRLLRSN